MNIVLATPLYPPDIAEPAPYVKELAKRLGSDTSHSVAIVTYGRLPEEIENVTILTVDKQQPLVFRIAAYTRALLKASRNADVVYAQNGASVELPVVLVQLFLRKKFVLCISDRAAHEHARLSGAYGGIEKLAIARAASVISDTPLPRPEIIPFDPYPTEEFTTYESSWKEHESKLLKLFSETIYD